MRKENAMTQDWINVSHGIGVPFGAIGTGYGMLGRYGFILPNFDSFPCQGKYSPFGIIENYDYLALHEKDRTNFLELSIRTNGEKYYFQEELLGQNDGCAANKVISCEFLPFAKHMANFADGAFSVDILTFTPLIPHQLQVSTTPALCMEIDITNKTAVEATYVLQLKFPEETPQMAAAFENSEQEICLQVDGNGSKKICAYLAWYYPEFTTPSPMLPDRFLRYYTRYFKNAGEVLDYAMEHRAEWKEKISAWQNSFDVPSAFKRMWFSSLSSVITSTMMSAAPMFFEIEAPHPWVNTMDVTVYSGWIYMINWPEIEKMDMYQYRKAIPTEGEDRGLVWHSLWDDRCDYVEEPCFITRIYRDYLWYNDKSFLEDMIEPVKMAFERVYSQREYAGLIEAKHGNQSYDVWKMPGVSTYVNMPWLYALYVLDRINKITGSEIAYEGKKPAEILQQAANSFVKYLWNEEKGYFNCFYRTEGARELSVPESVFTDQMFGRWLMLIEKDLASIIPEEKICRSVQYIYRNNLIDDPEHQFRGWSNGKLPDGVPCIDNRQYHVKTCWLGAQLNLASVLGELGYEEEMLDVFYSVEKSLCNNHLAVGEWNKSIMPDGKSGFLQEEVAKDTPRFPAYPRYKSCWELLVRLLGLKMNETEMELRPLKTISFAVKNVELAGCCLNVDVQENWKEILVDGQKMEKAVFDRGCSHTVEFRA